MALKYADNVGSQLFDNLSAASTFAVVESVSSFPAGISNSDPAVATIANDDNSLSEQVRITNIDRPTKTLTIDRGQYGSTALDWAKGSKLEIRISAGFMSEFEAQIKGYTDQQTTNTNNNVAASAKSSFAVAFILS